MTMVVYTALGTVVAVRVRGGEGKTIMCQKMFLRNKAF